jgi:hypothetical protein
VCVCVFVSASVCVCVRVCVWARQKSRQQFVTTAKPALVPSAKLSLPIHSGLSALKRLCSRTTVSLVLATFPC